MKPAVQAKRGRPRKHRYFSISKYLHFFEKEKNDYLNLKNRYFFLRMIALTLDRGAFRDLTERDNVVDYDEGIRAGSRFDDHGETFICLTCRKGANDGFDQDIILSEAKDRGKDFMLDLKHRARKTKGGKRGGPRLRLRLSCGHWIDLYLVCPVCEESSELWNEEVETLKADVVDHKIFCVNCGWIFLESEVDESLLLQELES